MTFRGHGKERWGKHTIESVSLCCSILFLCVPNLNKIVELWISHQTFYCCMAFSNGIDSGWAKIKYIVHLSEIVVVWIVAHEEYKNNCLKSAVHLFAHTSPISAINGKKYRSSIDRFNGISHLVPMKSVQTKIQSRVRIYKSGCIKIHFTAQLSRALQTNALLRRSLCRS